MWTIMMRENSCNFELHGAHVF